MSAVRGDKSLTIIQLQRRSSVPEAAAPRSAIYCRGDVGPKCFKELSTRLRSMRALCPACQVSHGQVSRRLATAHCAAETEKQLQLRQVRGKASVAALPQVFEQTHPFRG